MAEEKKISFGFSKLKAPPKVIPVATKPNTSKGDDNAKQFIDCLENHSIKVKNGIVEEKKELVIPLKLSNVRTINIKKEPELLKIIKEETEGDSNEASAAGSTADSKNQEVKPAEPPVIVKVEVDEKESLDAQARREILANLGKTGEGENETKVFTLPLTTNAPKEGEKESTLDDYDNIPIQEFGLAMLRGMGWKPDPNKNKNKPTDVVLRPKGLGLGADRSAVAQTTKTNSNSEDTKLIKNCCVKITGGISKNCYGKLESFNEDSGRVVVKLAIRDEHVTVSETLLIRVTKDEYDKNSRVINMNKYEEYKDKETTQDTKPDRHYKQRRNSNEDQTKRKSEREHSKYRDDSDSEQERRQDRKYKTSNESKLQERYKEKSSKFESSRNQKERNEKIRNRRDSYSSESEEDTYKSSLHKTNKDSSDKYQSRSNSSRDNVKKTYQKDNRNNSDSEHEYYDRKRKEHKSSYQKEATTSKKYSSKSRDSSTSSSSSEEEVSKKSSKHSKYVEKSSKKKYEEKKKKHSEKDKKKSKRKRRHSSSESEESSSSESSEEERKKKKKTSKHKESSSDSEDYKRKKKHIKKK